MAARNRTWTPDRVRQKIRVSMLINHLQNHVLGKIKMTATQLQAASILLRKSIPDLMVMAHSGSIDMKRPDELSDDALEHIARGGGTRDIGPQTSVPESGEVH
jgi:hypothetical protein